MIINGWKISDLPQRAEPQDYEKARQEVINDIKNVEGVEAIMDFGTEPYPGISDIDFYIVFSPEAKHIYVPKSKPYSEKTRYLMTHTVLLVSDEYLPSLRYLNPWSRFAEERYIWHKPDYQPKKAEELLGDTSIISASFMLDKLDAIFAYLPYLKNKELPVRHILEVCKNAVYCIWRLEDSNIQATQSQLDFVERFNKTRDNWYELPSEEVARATIIYFEEVMKIAFEIAWQLSTWLEDKVEYKPAKELGLKIANKTKWDKNNKTLYCHTYKYARLYTSTNLTPQQAFEMSLDSAKNVKVTIPGFRRDKTIAPAVLPWNLSAFLTTMACRSGILSNEIKKDTWVNQNSVPILEDEKYLRKIEIQNELTKKYKNKRKPGGSGKGYIYGNQVFGYLFDEETILRKLFVLLLRKHFFKKLNKIYKSN